MKKKSLLTTLALSAAFGAFANEPVQVGWDAINNPTGEGEEFPMYAWGQEFWADYNNDGKLDRFFIGGQDCRFALFENEGSQFTLVETEVTPLKFATLALFDFDNDGNIDLLISGKDEENSNHTELWKNSGAPDYKFEKVETFTNLGFCEDEGQVRQHFLQIADYDNDGWLDFFITGWTPETEGWHVRLYRNNEGYFEHVEVPVNDHNGRGSFRNILSGSIEVGDLNNDGYVDLVLSGRDHENGWETTGTVYFNNGDGTFREMLNPNFQGQKGGTTFLADINNDGYLDILEFGDNEEHGTIGKEGSHKRVGNLYLNNKDESFSAPIPAEDLGVEVMRMAPSVGDINNDGWIDILAMGSWEDDFTHIFYNKGDNTFADYFIPREWNAREGDPSLLDLDGDGFLDISINGWCDDWHNFLLLNTGATGITANQKPSVPTGLEIKEEGNDLIFSWKRSTDDTTPSEAIRYNIFIKSKEVDQYGDPFIYTYSPANVETSALKTAGKSHFISSTSIRLKGFNIEEYDFGVQAVDNGNLASDFAIYDPEVVGISSNESATIFIEVTNGCISLVNAENAIYSVYNINGSLVADKVKGNDKVNLAKGTYITKISNTNETIVKKVIVL